MRRCLMLVVAFGVGCSDSTPQLPTVTVVARDYTFEVTARGELNASESIPITVPDNINMGFNIAWLVPEYSEVEKGQVIVRFDDTQIQSDQEYSVLEIVNQDVRLETHARDYAISLARIDHEIDRVDGEKDIAGSFVDVDPALFSRNEIIDALGDLTYLEVEGEYYEWFVDTAKQRAGLTSLEISASRDASQAKLDKQRAALALMELTSPADGTFVYGRTPWGEKLSRGQQVFPGRPVGLLPIRGKVRARIFIPEFDAVGVDVNQSVAVRMDSDVTREFPAHITSVSAVAVPRHRDDPKKYIVVEAELDDVDAELMRVGSNLAATITTDTIVGAFLLPQQAVFFEDDRPFVYVIDDGEPSPREVTLGRRSSTLVEIAEGVVAGEQVSVAAPEGGAG